VLLLEKAYAKVYGSYEKIESGLAGHALRDLTGAPYEYFIRSHEGEIDANECWKFVWNYY
jgi:calpain-15